MKLTLKTVVIVGIVIIGGYYLLGTDAGSNLLSQTGTTIPTISTTADTSGVQVYSGGLTITTKTTDTSDPAVVYGGDAELTTICYDDNGNSDVDLWTPLDTGSSAEEEALTVPITMGASSAGGLTDMWCEISIGSAQDYYVDVAKLISQNSRISNIIYADPDNNNINSVVAQVNLIGISPPDPNTTPTLTLFYRLIDEGSLDVDSPNVIANVGQGSVENRIKWSMDMDNAGDGEYLQYVKFTINQTDDGMWFEHLSQIDVPNFGIIKLNDPAWNPVIVGTTTEYKYTFGVDQSDTVLVFVDKNGDTENNSHVIIQSNFDADNEGLCIELEIRTVDAQGAYTTNSDDVGIMENPQSASNCST